MKTRNSVNSKPTTAAAAPPEVPSTSTVPDPEVSAVEAQDPLNAPRVKRKYVWKKPRPVPQTNVERNRRFRARRRAEFERLRELRAAGKIDEDTIVDPPRKKRRKQRKKEPEITEEAEPAKEENPPDFVDNDSFWVDSPYESWEPSKSPIPSENEAPDEDLNETAQVEESSAEQLDEKVGNFPAKTTTSDSLANSELLLIDEVDPDPIDDSNFRMDSPYASHDDFQGGQSDVEAIQDEEVNVSPDKTVKQPPVVNDELSNAAEDDDLSARDAEETAGLPRCACCGEIELYVNSCQHSTTTTSSKPTSKQPTIPETTPKPPEPPKDEPVLPDSPPKALIPPPVPPKVQLAIPPPSILPIRLKHHVLECPICGRKFRNEPLCLVHIHKHNGVRSLPCRKEGCKALFWDTEGRYSHEIRCGAQSRQQECKICGRLCRNEKTLLSHLIESHEQKPFLCDLCGASYKRQHHLDDHKLNKHVGVRFTCNICKKQFKSEFYMKRHRKHIHRADDSLA